MGGGQVDCKADRVFSQVKTPQGRFAFIRGCTFEAMYGLLIRSISVFLHSSLSTGNYVQEL
jgi:hypothetical protein